MKLRALWRSLTTRPVPEGEDTKWNVYRVFPARSSIVSNAARRLERGVRLGLGGALIYVLSMIDTASLDYSFRYVGPFIYWVVATLTPPFISTIPLLLFAGMFCIVVACCTVSVLIAFATLGGTTGKVLAVVFYAIFLGWVLGLNVGKKKEMTIIGSYILTYVMPLAALIALPYSVGGITVKIPSEVISKVAAALQSESPQVYHEVVTAVANGFRMDPNYVDRNLTRLLSSPLMVNMILMHISAQLHVKIPLYSMTQQLNPLTVIKHLTQIFLAFLAPDKFISIPIRFDQLKHLGELSWIKPAHCKIEGSLRRGFTFHVDTGLWLLRAMWTAHGRIGFLRNLLAFAALGFAIWVLVMIIPPVHRQRDVVRRNLANCTININRCLRATREVLHCLEGALRGGGRSAGSSQLSCPPSQRETHRMHLSSPGAVDASSSALLGETGGLGAAGARRYPPDGANHDVSLAVPLKRPPRVAGGRKRESGKTLSPRAGGLSPTPVDASPRAGGERLEGSASCYIRAYTYSSAKFQDALVPLKQSIIEITDDQKRVFLSGMEPYLLSAGPMVFVVKEVEEVRQRMLQCAAYVQQLCRVLFDVVRTSIVNAEFCIWLDTLSTIEVIIAKAEESYQTCGELIMMQPPLLFRKEHRKAVEEKINLLDRLEVELQELHSQVSHLANEATDRIFNDFGRSSFSSSNQDYSSTLATAVGTKSAADSEASAGMPAAIETVPDHQAAPAMPTVTADTGRPPMEERPLPASGDGARPGPEANDNHVDDSQRGKRKGDAEGGAVMAQTSPTGPGPSEYRNEAAAGGTADAAGKRQQAGTKKGEREALLRRERSGEQGLDATQERRPFQGKWRENLAYGQRAPDAPQHEVRVLGLPTDPSRGPAPPPQRHVQQKRSPEGRINRAHSGAGMARDDAVPLAASASFRRISGRSWGSNSNRTAAGGRTPSAGEGGKSRASSGNSTASLDQNEARNVCRTMDHMPLSMALVAKYHAAYKEPVALAKAVKALHAAQRRSTLKGLCMNLVFPLLPILVHAARLTIVPAKQLLVWRLKWKGHDAWWRDAEACYIVKFYIPMVILFAFAVFFKEFSQYTWGEPLTDNPTIMDFCTQGITTRMVPWIMLGFLTCFQTTYNGTMFRGVNRTVGIVCGSFAAWLVMKTCDHNIAKIVCFSCCLLGLDIFIAADTKNPNYGFHRVWGYAGMVFTYTQALIVGLAFEDLGGITGGRDYLTVTRIVSSILGIVLAVVVAHVPPACSGNNATAVRYGEALECCSHAVEKAVQYLLEASEPGPCEGHGALKHTGDRTPNTPNSTDNPQTAKSVAATVAAGEDSSGKADSPTTAAGAKSPHRPPATEDERLSLNTKGATEAVSEEGSAGKGRPRSEVCSVGVGHRHGPVQSYLQDAKAAVQGEAADKLQAGQQLYKEGCSAMLIFPWRTVPVLEEIYLTLGTMRNRVEDMCDLLQDFMTEGYTVADHTLGLTGQQTSGSQGSAGAASGGELRSDRATRLPKRDIDAADGDSLSKRKGSLFVLKEGNAVAVTELFVTRSGDRFRTEMAAAVQALSELSSAVATELKLLLPTTVDRLMSLLFLTWPRSKVYSGLPDAVHEQCRNKVETAFSHLMITLSNCLAEHRTLFKQSAARRRAAAFTIMALIYYLDMHKRALDSIHESLVACRESPAYWGWLGNCLKPSIKGLGVD